MDKINLIVVLVIVVGLVFAFSNMLGGGVNEFTGNSVGVNDNIEISKINYETRGDVSYEKEFMFKNGSIDVYLVQIETRQILDEHIKIFGYLLLPEILGKNEKLPGILTLPAGQATKDHHLPLALELAKKGNVVLTIDQRGVGDTGGRFLSYQEDYLLYAQSNGSMQHLAVFDVLRCVDLLRDLENVNDENIIIVGESMGGRYGMIATAIDKGIKGFIGISTAGLGVIDEGKPYSPYLLSIDPDSYVSSIYPRDLYLLHCKNDSVVPIDSAKNTMMKYGIEENLIEFEGCNHGYNPVMEKQFYDLLNSIIS